MNITMKGIAFALFSAAAVSAFGAGQKETRLSADVCVIGSGAAGTSAALEAAEAGKKVIVLEKLSFPGGNSAIGAEGLLAADSKLQLDAGIKPFKDQLFADWMEFTHWKSDAALVRQYIDLSGDTVGWLTAHGMDLIRVPSVQKGRSYETYIGYKEYGERINYFKKLLASVEKAGGQVLYATPATSLLVDAKGAVTGVKAVKKDGTTVVVDAKAVIIASGGASDAAWTKEYSGGYDRFSVGMSTNNGDAIKAAWAVGAAKDRVNLLQYHANYVPGLPAGGGAKKPGLEEDLSVNYPMALVYLPCLPDVNVNGTRYSNEDINYDSSLHASATAQQGDHTFVIITQDQLDKLGTKGSSALGMSDSPRMQRNQDLCPINQGWGKGLAGFMDVALESKSAFKADTLEDLAKAAGINAKNLVKTIDTYNADSKAGKDSMMGKSAVHMPTLEKGPYYAIKKAPIILSSLGGLKINSDFQVMKADDTALRNVYAAGAVTGVIYGDIYPLFEGGTLGWSFNSGRLSARYAVSNMK